MLLYEALKIYQDEYGENHPMVADISVNIGRIASEMRFYKKINEALANITDEKTDEQTDSYFGEYFTRFKKALEIYNKTYGEYRYSVAATYTYLGRLYILFESLV
jgi:hypothetical protein